MSSDRPDKPMDDTPLPESTEAIDPKAQTVVRRSDTLKKIITAFQSGDPDSINAALDIDRTDAPSLDSPSKAPTDEKQTDEKTILSPTAFKTTLPPTLPEPEKPVEAHVLVPKERPLPKVIDSETVTQRPPTALTGAPDEAPWTLQQFFSGSIDLDVELSKRFPAMPMLSIIKFRTLGSESGRRVATLSTQDGAASLVFDADMKTKIVQLSFTLGSMLTLKFQLSELTDSDRNYWLDLMRRDAGGLAFLWGQGRWANDYIICIARKYFTNFYAFSTNNFDAAVRLTPAVTKQLMDWLDEIWKAENDGGSDEPPPLLTW
jgi:hypothetical protein